MGISINICTSLKNQIVELNLPYIQTLIKALFLSC